MKKQKRIEEMSALSLNELTGIYNGIVEKPIKAFKCSKAQAIEKILALDPVTLPVEKKSSTKKTKPAAKKNVVTKEKLVAAANKKSQPAAKKTNTAKVERVTKRSILRDLFNKGLDKQKMFDKASKQDPRITMKDVRWMIRFMNKQATA